MDIRGNMLEILESVVPGIDYEEETALVDDELLESLDIVTIVAEIMDTFAVELNVNDILPENFNSLEAMAALVQERMENQ